MLKIKSSHLITFFGIVAVIILTTLLGPEEKALGSNVRIVYLHGAWVLTAEIGFISAAFAGVLGLIGHFFTLLKNQQEKFFAWSQALGRTGIVFWVTYLPLSLWAMKSNWNGLFLAEPRFRLALTFAVVGILMQAGLSMIGSKMLTAAANIAYIIVLRIIFASAANIMHPPPSPIFNSGNYLIISFFVGLNFLTWIAGYFLTRWWLSISTE